MNDHLCATADSGLEFLGGARRGALTVELEELDRLSIPAAFGIYPFDLKTCGGAEHLPGGRRRPRQCFDQRHFQRISADDAGEQGRAEGEQTQLGLGVHGSLVFIFICSLVEHHSGHV
ncbi:hypothetical protein D3C84_1010350 [compost metagenome]